MPKYLDLCTTALHIQDHLTCITTQCNDCLKSECHALQLQESSAPLNPEHWDVKRQKAVAKSLGTCMRVQLLALLFPVQVCVLCVYVNRQEVEVPRTLHSVFKLAGTGTLDRQCLQLPYLHF